MWGSSSIAKSVKSLSFTVGGYDATLKTQSVTTVVGSPCGSGEVGFVIHGQVKAVPFDTKTATVTICLGADSGSGTTGSFGADLGNSGATIATAAIDPATSNATL